MGARDLLADLVGAGLHVAIDGDHLLIRPASRLTDCMRAALLEAKAELLVLLRDLQSVPESIDLAPVSTACGDVVNFHALRPRMVLRGWTVPEAEAWAGRLAQRDRELDERISCTECRHYHPGRCGNFRRAGLAGSALSRDLAAVLQRCAGFQSVNHVDFAPVHHSG